jgi:hypothetical protein
MTKGLADLSELMDKRLLRMRQLAWKLEKAHSVVDVEDERKHNMELHDDWNIKLNSNLSFTERYFGSQQRNTLEVDIAGGFTRIHEEFNRLFASGKLDQDAVVRIKNDLDSLNRTIYLFDLEMTGIIKEQPGRCSTLP